MDYDPVLIKWLNQRSDFVDHVDYLYGATNPASILFAIKYLEENPTGKRIGYKDLMALTGMCLNQVKAKIASLSRKKLIYRCPIWQFWRINMENFLNEI